MAQAPVPHSCSKVMVTPCSGHSPLGVKVAAAGQGLEVEAARRTGPRQIKCFSMCITVTLGTEYLTMLI